MPFERALSTVDLANCCGARDPAGMDRDARERAGGSWLTPRSSRFRPGQARRAGSRRQSQRPPGASAWKRTLGRSDPSVLFDAPFGRDLVLKGGTSLEKAYTPSRRSPEDIDITTNIRGFAPDLVANAGEEALPATRSQERRWTRAIRTRLARWAQEQALPAIHAGPGHGSASPLGFVLKETGFLSAMSRCSMTTVLSGRK